MSEQSAAESSDQIADLRILSSRRERSEGCFILRFVRLGSTRLTPVPEADDETAFKALRLWERLQVQVKDAKQARPAPVNPWLV